MKFGVKNLGPINEACIELGDLTIICGKNNTGKTYLTYTLSTFLDTIHKNLSMPVDKNIFDELMLKGIVSVDLVNYVDAYIATIQKALPGFTKSLPRFLAMPPDRFKNTQIKLELSAKEVITKITQDPKSKANIIAQITPNCNISMTKKGSSSIAVISLLNKGKELPDHQILESGVSFLLGEAFSTSLFCPVLPKTFVITCERTGAALFRTELIISNQISTENDTNIDRRKKLNGQYEFRGYQFPVAKDLEFVVNLKTAALEESFIQAHYKDIVSLLPKIVGGEYIFDEDSNQVKFRPDGTTESLSLAESSSTVRALMEFNFYLKHKATPSQILVFDEPELNLHPENQRRLARLLARLVNAGIKVFITTHSDYIIKELNTLLMLNYSDDPRMPELQKKYGYSSCELLKAEQLRVYCMERSTITPVEVSQDVGIGISSFDENIREMGKMQRDILYGGIKNA